jgi:hypothetical protein
VLDIMLTIESSSVTLWYVGQDKTKSAKLCMLILEENRDEL